MGNSAGAVGKEILLHPTAHGVERYLTAELCGDYEGLLRLTMGKNKCGGCQGLLPSLPDALSFEIQAIALTV